MTSEDIKDLRTQLGMSQQAFAASLGVSFATVNRWENGKAKPQKDRIERMRMFESVDVPGPGTGSHPA
jgi:DNA-binding transcriptional regulator YiaG